MLVCVFFLVGFVLSHWIYSRTVKVLGFMFKFVPPVVIMFDFLGSGTAVL